MYGTGYPPDMIKSAGKRQDRPFPYERIHASTAKDLSRRRLLHSIAFPTGRHLFKESVQAIKDIGYEGWIISELFYTGPNLNRGTAKITFSLAKERT